MNESILENKNLAKQPTRRDFLKQMAGIAALTITGSEALVASEPINKINDTSRALQGVNLGGWLVAERWMTPKVFDGVQGEGERAIGRSLSKQEAEKRISTHRDTFITENDFRWISDHGFDFVRLPFGYWLVEDAEGYTAGQEYLSKAFAWAEKYRLKVLLDFHGLQGSQNGNDHSGETGHIGFYEGDNMNQALLTIQSITRSYGQSKSLLGIEVINEPEIQSDITSLINYYEEAYAIVAAGAAPEAKVIISDGFQHKKILKALGRHSFGERLIVDTHLYQLFTEKEKNMSLEEHLRKIDKVWKHILESDLEGRALVGEWTAALPNKAVQGTDVNDALKIYYEKQKKLFDVYAWGHSIWSYKAPGSSWWSYRDLPFTNR